MNEKLKSVYTSQDLNNFNDFFSQFKFKKFTSDEKMYELIMFGMMLHILILNQTYINYKHIVLNFHKIGLNFNQIVINFNLIRFVLCNQGMLLLTIMLKIRMFNYFVYYFWILV